MKWGIYLICAFLPTYLIRFEIFGLPITVLEVMILILFATWLIRGGYKNVIPAKAGIHSFVIPAKAGIHSFVIPAKAGIHSFVIPAKAGIHKNKLLFISAGLFLLSATISMFISPDLRAAAGIWKAYFVEPILFLIVFLSVIKKKDLKWVIFALGFSALYISLYAIGQKFFGLPITIPWQDELRATSIFPFPNAVGLFLAPIIPLLIDHCLSFPRRRESIFFISTAVLSIIAIYFAKSEGALVAIVASAILWGLIYNKNSRRITISIILIGFISCILLSNTILFSEIKTKLLLQDWSGKVRLTIWTETWEMLKDKPIFGAGLAGYQTAIIPYHKSANWMEVFLYPHNIILNFWSELGLLGVLSFILIVIGFYKNCRLPIMIAMTVLLIHGLVDVPYFKNDLSILFWLLVGISLILVDKNNEYAI